MKSGLNPYCTLEAPTKIQYYIFSYPHEAWIRPSYSCTCKANPVQPLCSNKALNPENPQTAKPQIPNPQPEPWSEAKHPGRLECPSVSAETPKLLKPLTPLNPEP